jgi:translation initiation factor 1
MRPAQQRGTVRLDRKARGGNSATIIEGLQMPQQSREEFLRQLKARPGTGGTVKGAGVEIQGDHRNALMGGLKKMGYRPKRSGD